MKYLLMTITWLLVCVFAVQAEQDLCRIADTALVQAGSISGLALRKKVPCRVQSRSEIKSYMLATIDEKITPERMQHEEIVYRALGFIPEEYDYQKGLVEMYLGQIAGYYDPDLNRFVMAGWMPEAMQGVIAVHEQTHALQDQHFQLEKFVDTKNSSSDELMARAALMEGQAVAVQTDYQRRLMGQGPLAGTGDVQALMLQNLLSVAFIPELRKAPPGMVSMMIFPYTSGLMFAHALLREGGYKVVNGAFKYPPLSTEEILHPEKFNTGKADFKKLSEVEVLTACGFEGGKVVYTDVLGEFFISTLLNTFGVEGEKAAVAAAGWGGDAVLITAGADKHSVAWKIHWDSLDEAKEFSSEFKPGFKKTHGKSLREDNWTGLPGGKEVRFRAMGQDTALCIRYKVSS